MSLTVVGSVNALENLKNKSKCNSVITKIMTNLKTLCCLLLFSFIFASCSAAQKTPLPESKTKTIESSDRVNPETKRFESKTGNFSINISQTPFQTQTLDALEGEEEPSKQFLWQFEKIGYMIIYSAFDKNDLSQALYDMNQGAIKGVLRAGGRLISEKEFSFGKYQGKEFRFIATNGNTYIYRNYLVNNKGYTLSAKFIDEESEKDALEVLDSFKLLNEKN